MNIYTRKAVIQGVPLVPMLDILTILLIFFIASWSMILIFLPSMATIFSAANADNVLMALEVVMFDRLAKSSRVR